MVRGAWCLTLAVAASVLTGAAFAEDVDSEHIFGFTEGTDIGEKGEREGEFGVFGRLGKQGGRYFGLTQSNELKATITDQFRVSPGVFFSHYSINNVPGLPNYNGGGPDGFSFEMKYRVFDREKDPFGLTLAMGNALSRIDPMGGGTQTNIGSNIFASLDKELVKGTLYGAFNVGWAPSVTQARGAAGWERASELSVSGALAFRATDKFLMGAELRYARAFDGVTFNHSNGHALFAGPTFYLRLAKNAWIAGVWNFQVAGKTFTQPGSLDLVNYERHQARLRLGIGF
jgi:hypothetical protein